MQKQTTVVVLCKKKDTIKQCDMLFPERARLSLCLRRALVLNVRAATQTAACKLST
jgi:hypothetical protein